MKVEGTGSRHLVSRNGAACSPPSVTKMDLRSPKLSVCAREMNHDLVPLAFCQGHSRLTH